MAINPGNVNYQVGDMLTAAQYNTTHNSLVKAIEEDNSRVITPSSLAPTSISSGHWLFATIPGVYTNFPFITSSGQPLEVASMAIIRYNGSGWDKYEISASDSGGGDGGPVQSFVYFNLNSTYNLGDIVGYNYPISFEGTTFEFLEFYRCLSDGTSGILPTSENGHWVSIGSRYIINAILGELSDINMGMQNMHTRVYSLERIARNDRIVIPPIENNPSFRHPNFEILTSRSGSSSSLILNTLGGDGDQSNALTVYHSAAIRTGNNLIVSGNAVFDNNVTVSRNLNTDQLNVTGNTTLGGDLNVAGNLSLTGALNTTGTINVASLIASGTLQGNYISGSDANILRYTGWDINTTSAQHSLLYIGNPLNYAAIEAATNKLIVRGKINSNSSSFGVLEITAYPNENSDTPGSMLLDFKSINATNNTSIPGNLYIRSTGKDIYVETPYIRANGNVVVSGTVTQSSDSRLKTDIVNLTPRGELRPVSFMKDGEPGIGFIAQEVKELYPELVYGDESLSLNYSQLTAVIYAELKALREEVALLRAA